MSKHPKLTPGEWSDSVQEPIALLQYYNLIRVSFTLNQNTLAHFDKSKFGANLIPLVPEPQHAQL